MKYIRKQKDPRGKVARWLVELENFDYRVEYVPGKDNVEADYLSRIEIPERSNEPESIQEKACIYHAEEQTCVYFEDVILPTMTVIKHHQANDSAIADAMKQLKQEGQVSNGIFRNYSNLAMDGEILWKGERIVIPVSLQQTVLKEYHPGVKDTTLMLKSRFY